MTKNSKLVPLILNSELSINSCQCSINLIDAQLTLINAQSSFWSCKMVLTLLILRRNPGLELAQLLKWINFVVWVWIYYEKIKLWNIVSCLFCLFFYFESSECDRSTGYVNPYSNNYCSIYGISNSLFDYNSDYTHSKSWQQRILINEDFTMLLLFGRVYNLPFSWVYNETICRLCRNSELRTSTESTSRHS